MTTTAPTTMRRRNLDPSQTSKMAPRVILPRALMLALGQATPARAKPCVPKVVKKLLSWGNMPSDLLLEVAVYLRDDRYAMLSITGVCTYWRRVFIECPLNWTQVSTKCPLRLFKVWLQRSKNVPVDAEICNLPNGLVPLLRSKDTPFRSLRCTLNKANFTTLFGGLTKVSPNLERLELYRRNADQGSSINRLRIISGSMPSLKDLRLASIDLTPEILKLRHLVNLELAHPFASMTAILDLVVSNPLLETVAFSIKCSDETDPRPEGAVIIPRLRTLKFDFYSPLPLLRKLSIPRGASVSFLLWAEMEEYEVILPESLEHLQNLSEVKNLFIQRRSGYCIEASGPSGEVKFEGKNEPYQELERLPLQSVEKFRFAESQQFIDVAGKGQDLGWLSKVFERSRNLRTFVIDSCGLATMKDIFRLLSPQPNLPPGGPLRLEGLPCHSLSTIILEVPHDGSWSDWAVPFLKMLRDRAAAGLRLQKLRIVSGPQAQIPRQGEEQMANLVPCVEFKYKDKDGVVDEGRLRELFEWQHDRDGFEGGDLRVASASVNHA
ncbi:hypothetical protein BJ322DRAFT_1213148 [Thelephora terrestris]|uniref:F-box domain-containing protein n=1 Tax=Thelephora terrestris TaxID=56493 RepID=A0A9P6H8Z0_9AGAM|nr:hypothetical protein BJ322DRAFT_1213148 [Thelephora terrestris]